MLRASICFLLLCCPGMFTNASALQITSLQPTSAAPGEIATLSGNNWPEEFQLLLGETVVPFEKLSVDAVRIRIPDLPAGEYLISYRDTGAALSTPTRFTLKLLGAAPLIDRIIPDQVPACREEGVDIIIQGRQLDAATHALLDDGILRIKSRSAEEITIELPQLAAGLHRLQLVNRDEKKSLAATLEVTGQPRIDQLQIEDDQVVSYPIRIIGVNFTPQSRLLVNGTPVVNHPGILKEGDDRVSYLDCSTLIYQRYPLTGQTRDLQFQIQNPDGQASNSVSLKTK